MKNKLTRNKKKNKNLLIFALISVITFLSIELFSRIYELYKYYPPIDLPTHFFGGIALATIIYYVISTTSIKKKMFTVFILTFVGAIIWELFESIEELIIENFIEIPDYMRDIFFWDGFMDIIITSLGGFMAIILIGYLKNRKILNLKFN